MATFKGIVEEFPEIRIDYFRAIAGRIPPLAGFLSHVHSDHLLGLESLKAPFVYCSSATRELLLRLEKYPHRMNFAKGVLETRKQHYRHLRHLLKSIPLNAPTEIELRPGRSIRVTLLDANHCAGAVMFLIEDPVKAILYTGDVRSEPWFVNALVRNPVLIPYAHGHSKLDKLYLDTTFATRDGFNRSFPTKADGLKELLEKVMRYPKDTVFHFHAWTPGYEEVWIALASALRSQVHVDRYKMELYKSLAPASSGASLSSEGHVLCGFKYGNREQAGCLTSDHTVKLHSCERGTSCPTLDTSDVVWITPIISRSKEGVIIPEFGAGGGEGDLTQPHELELSDPKAALELMRLCLNNINDKKAQEKALGFLSSALSSHKKSVSLDSLGLEDYEDPIPLMRLPELLAKVTDKETILHWQDRPLGDTSTVPMTVQSRKVYEPTRKLPRSIQFPYSRHSSYDELCHLVESFSPVDIYPCTVDEDSWTWDASIRSLFGHLCSGSVFAHDNEMVLLQGGKLASHKPKRRRDESSSQDYLGNLRRECVDSDERLGQEAVRIEPTVFDQNQNSRSPNERQERPRKRSRTSQESVRNLTQCPTQPIGLRSSNVPSVCPHASQQSTNGPGKTSASRKPILSNDPSPSNTIDDIRNSMKSWLETPGSNTKPLSQGEFGPTFQPMSEISVAASTPTNNIEVRPRNSHFSVEASLRDNSKEKEYRCRWQTCIETFELLPKLRQHIFQDHLTAGNVGQPSNYVCLWGNCSRPDTPAYPTEESRIDHLNASHHSNWTQIASTKIQKIDRSLAMQSSDSQDSKEHAVGPLTDLANNNEDSNSARLQDPTGTQACAISLSSQATSNPALPASLFQTVYPSIDDADLASSTESGHEFPEYQDSQLSVSSSTFESQPLQPLYTQDEQHTANERYPNPEISAQKVQNRKEAYRAARGRWGLGWANLELLSSGGGHGQLEMDL